MANTALSGWIQDPDSVLDYTFDWSEWLRSGETITLYNVTTAPHNHTDALTANVSEVSDTKITVWLQGGVLNKKYHVTSTITTSDGREESATVVILIKNK